MGKSISLEQLTMENVRELSEKEVSEMLNRLISDYPKSLRPQYTDILSSTFDFRSISSHKSDLKDKMVRSGYKFFPIPYNSKLVMAVKNKSCLN